LYPHQRVRKGAIRFGQKNSETNIGLAETMGVGAVFLSSMCSIVKEQDCGFVLQRIIAGYKKHFWRCAPAASEWGGKQHCHRIEFMFYIYYNKKSGKMQAVKSIS
jgi:hypothetical protein